MITILRCVAATLGAWVLFAVEPDSAHADKCVGAKLKAIGKLEAGLLGCQSKLAATNDASALAACETKAMSKFTAAFAKAGACVGDDSTCAAFGKDCADTVSAAMTDTLPSKCEASKRKAAGKLASGEIACYSRAAKKDASVESACIAKAAAKFADSLAKAGPCPDGASPQTVVEYNCVQPAMAVDGGGAVIDVCPTPPTTLPPNVPVAAIYFPRYGTSALDGLWRFWDAANPFAPFTPPLDIASDYYPVLGPYSANDASVIDQHLSWLESAGINLIIVSWLGQGSYEDMTLPLLFERASLTDIRVAFEIDPYTGRSATSIVDDVSYLYGQYGSYPAFYRTTRTSGNNPDPQPKGVFFLWASFFEYVTEYFPGFNGIPADAAYWQPAVDAIHALPQGGIVIANPAVVYEEAISWIETGHFDGVYNFSPQPDNDLPENNWFALWARELPPGAWYVPTVNPGTWATRIGYDPSTYRARDSGNFYATQWAQALGTDIAPVMVTINSFNEWNEGTQIEPAADDADNGAGFDYLDYEGLGPNGYLDLTSQWRQSAEAMSWPGIDGATTVSATLGATNAHDGLWQFDLYFVGQDGMTEADVISGEPCRKLPLNNYMYFAVHNDFIYAAETSVTMEVEYCASGTGLFLVEYDSTDTGAPVGGKYTPTSIVNVSGPDACDTAAFALPNAYFGNRQKFGADFRIPRSADPGFELCVRRVAISLD